MSTARSIRQLLDALDGIELEQEALDTRRGETVDELLGAICDDLPEGTDPELLTLGANACADLRNRSGRCVYEEDGDECLFCQEPPTIEDK